MGLLNQFRPKWAEYYYKWKQTSVMNITATWFQKSALNTPPAPTPFLLGEGLPPIPAKLVAKIQKGYFVDMAELLWDNIEAERRWAKQRGHQLVVGAIYPESLGGVRYIQSWIQCFGMFACVVVARKGRLWWCAKQGGVEGLADKRMTSCSVSRWQMKTKRIGPSWSLFGHLRGSAKW